jgi:single-stranded-DNA-specific exonuclease
LIPDVTLIRPPHRRIAPAPVDPLPGGQPLEAMAFGAFDSPLGPALETSGTRPFHLAGKLEVNTWGGRSRVQLRLDDAAPA